MSCAYLPLALDVVAVATESKQDTTTQVVQLLAPTFGVFSSWRLLRDLEEAGIIVVTPLRKVVWTPLGRKLHADIESVVATVQDVEGSS